VTSARGGVRSRLGCDILGGVAWPIKHPKLQDLEWLTEQKLTRSLKDIAAEVGCDQSAVSRALSRKGITVTPIPDPHYYRATLVRPIDVEAAGTLYRQGRTVGEVAAVMGLSYGQAHLRIKRSGAALRQGRPLGSRSQR